MNAGEAQRIGLEDGAELQGMAVPEQESDFSDVEDMI